ncbi:MAG: hypothetical protein ABEK04_06200, partial [Candidatus Nanohalobium sp.]
LRSYTEHQEFYLETIQTIIDNISNFFGKQMALGYARKAPLEVTPEGEVKAYYGKGRKALEILAEEFENDIGKEAADQRIKNALDDLPDEKKKLIPEKIRPEESTDNGGGLFSRFKGILA